MHPLKRQKRDKEIHIPLSETGKYNILQSFSNLGQQLALKLAELTELVLKVAESHFLAGLLLHNRQHNKLKTASRRRFANEDVITHPLFDVVPQRICRENKHGVTEIHRRTTLKSIQVCIAII